MESPSSECTPASDPVIEHLLARFRQAGDTPLMRELQAALIRYRQGRHGEAPAADRSRSWKE